MDDDSEHDDLQPTELSDTRHAEPQGAPVNRIGPYRLLDKLGEGGMGEVWLAEQQEPVRRKVALKVIKQGMDTKQVIARFEAERQALALMDHPAIAKIYDAGATPAGRPYFVMEHVQGVPITEYCDRHRLTNRERLDLFLQICEGVQHAHHKAVIHRDLKPSNVLVSIRDDKPVPKIIDFGVAKATSQKLTEMTMHTALGVMIGTPAYMSPEQAEMTGQDVDTRTDVYSLGAMLYELLVGALPFDTKQLLEEGYEAMVRRIREEEPSRPSARLTTLGEHSTHSAKRRRTEVPALKRELSGDLDWITMRALEKDRTRRYGSPQDFAADIRRYLADEPVLATPPSAAYRAKKFVRRHTWGVTAATTGVIVLVAFAVTMAIQAKRIAAQRDVAEQAQADLESMLEFQAGMLSATDPEEMGRRLMEDLTARVTEARRAAGATEAELPSVATDLESLLTGVNATDLALGVVDEDILGRAVVELDEKFADRPLIAARLRTTIGSTYLELGRYERAESQLTKALEIRKRELGEDDPETLWSMNSLAGLYHAQGRYAESDSLNLEALEGRRRVLGDDHEDTLWAMGFLARGYLGQQRSADAETLYVEMLETRKRVLGDDHPDTVRSMLDLANVIHGQGRHTEAEPLFLAAVEASQRTLGEDHPITLGSMNGLARLYDEQGRFAEAEPLYLATLETRKRVLGADHSDTIDTMIFLSSFYAKQGRFAESEPLDLEILKTRQRVLGNDHFYTLSAMHNLANLYVRWGRYAEAESRLLETIEARRRVLGDDHPFTFNTMKVLAKLYDTMGRYSEAEPRFLECIQGYEHVFGADHPHPLDVKNSLAGMYVKQGRFAEAKSLYVETVEGRKRVLGEEHSDTLASMNGLASLYLNREPANSRELQAALSLALDVAEKTQYENPEYLGTLALAYHLTGDTAAAIANQKKAIGLLPEGESGSRDGFEDALKTFEGR